MIDIELFKRKAKARFRENQLLIKQLGRMDGRKLDKLVQELHDEVFEEIDCLECANCCKTLGPRITPADVKGIAEFLKMKEAVIEANFLKRDEDNDLVFKSMPCPFLDDNNLCKIYSGRPKACREYPHTDRRRFYQILDLTLKNSLVCPAVLEILERIRKRI